jgi:hypothetical protein
LKRTPKSFSGKARIIPLPHKRRHRGASHGNE